MDLKVLWTGIVYIMAGTIGGLLWARWWTFAFHKMQGLAGLGEQRRTRCIAICLLCSKSYCQVLYRYLAALFSSVWLHVVLCVWLIHRRWCSCFCCLFLWPDSPCGPFPHLWCHSITLGDTTHGRTPLYMWSARRRDYLTTHSIHKVQTSTTPAGF